MMDRVNTELKYQDLLNENSLKAFREFKYAGSDKSIIYNKATSPFCQYLVDNHIPATLAPNTITLLGLLCSLIPHLLVIFYASNEPGRFFHLLMGVGLFVYYIMDNCDGKQARKLQNSSVLGMLFDHGCDCLNTVLTSITMAKLMMLTDFQTGVVLFLTGSMFFFAILEQNYTHRLDLGIVNSVNEGIATVIFFCLIGLFFGSSFWLVELFGVKLNVYSLLLTLILSIVFICINIKNILAANQTEGKLKQLSHDCYFLLSYGLPLITYGLIRGTSFVFHAAVEAQAAKEGSPAVAASTAGWLLQGSQTHKNLNTAFCFIFGINVCKICTFLQICHAGKVPFVAMRLLQKIWNITMIVLVLIALIDFSFLSYLIYLVVLLVIADYLEFVFVAVVKIAEMLGIKVLSVNPPPQSDTSKGDVEFKVDTSKDDELSGDMTSPDQEAFNPTANIEGQFDPTKHL